MNNKGFSLIELLAVMIILGVLAAFVIPRYITLDNSAELQALEMGIKELNSREKLVWTQAKLSSTSYNDEDLDTFIISKVDTDIGEKYSLNGSTLKFGSNSVNLIRVPATNKAPAKWEKNNG